MIRNIIQKKAQFHKHIEQAVHDVIYDWYQDRIKDFNYSGSGSLNYDIFAYYNVVNHRYEIQEAISVEIPESVFSNMENGLDCYYEEENEL